VDYYQRVVAEFLRADKAMLVNPECSIQFVPGRVPPKGTSWYCDVMAANFRERRAYLCEVTYLPRCTRSSVVYRRGAPTGVRCARPSSATPPYRRLEDPAVDVRSQEVPRAVVRKTEVADQRRCRGGQHAAAGDHGPGRRRSLGIPQRPDTGGIGDRSRRGSA
jgi:hypothetical protein